MRLEEITTPKEFFAKVSAKFVYIFVLPENFSKLINQLKSNGWRWQSGLALTDSERDDKWFIGTNSNCIVLRNNGDIGIVGIDKNNRSNHLVIDVEWDMENKIVKNSSKCCCASPIIEHKVFSTFEYDYCSFCKKEV